MTITEILEDLYKYANMIKELRKEKGLTQKQLAEKSGISEISIRKYETGERRPKIQTLKKISDALDVPLSTFVGDMKLPNQVVTWEKSEYAIRRDSIIEILKTHKYKIKKDNLYYIITSPQGDSYYVSFSKFDDLILRSDKDIIYNIDKILFESKRKDTKE